MADVFISYAHEDREWVEKFAASIKMEGISVWWAPDLLPGIKFREKIRSELKNAKAVLVVWSTWSLQSDWVHDEAEEAKELGIIVPVFKERVNAPAGFRQVQTADLTDWRGGAAHPEFEKVIASIKLIKARSSPSDPEPVHQTTDAGQPAPPPEKKQRRPRVPKPPAKALDGDASLQTQPQATGTVPPSQTQPQQTAGRPGMGGAIKWVAIGVAAVVVAFFLYRYAAPPQQPAGPDIAKQADGASADAEKSADDANKAIGEVNAAADQARALEPQSTPLTGTDPDGQAWSYAGQTQNGQPDGLGVKRWTMRAGAKCVATDGTQAGLHYAGHWAAGQKAGWGVNYKCNGGTYAGNHKDNLPDGLGVYTAPDGTAFMGSYAARVTILGVKTWPIGSAVVREAGHWSDRGLTGLAVVTCGDHSVWKGLWLNDDLVGPGIKYDPQGGIAEQGTYGPGNPQGLAVVCGKQR